MGCVIQDGVCHAGLGCHSGEEVCHTRVGYEGVGCVMQGYGAGVRCVIVGWDGSLRGGVCQAGWGGLCRVGVGCVMKG